MEESPEFTVKANALVATLGGLEKFLVVETAPEVRAKIAELREQGSYSLGEEEGDRSGFLILLGLDIYAEAGRPEGPRIEPFDVGIHPGTVGVIREVTDSFWQAHIESIDSMVRQQNLPAPPERGDMIRELRGVLDSMGFAVVGGGTIAQDAYGMKPALASEVDPETKCCCGDKASVHRTKGAVIGSCEKCPCGLFHTHDTEPEGGH